MLSLFLFLLYYLYPLCPYFCLLELSNSNGSILKYLTITVFLSRSTCIYNSFSLYVFSCWVVWWIQLYDLFFFINYDFYHCIMNPKQKHLFNESIIINFPQVGNSFSIEFYSLFLKYKSSFKDRQIFIENLHHVRDIKINE